MRLQVSATMLFSGSNELLVVVVLGTAIASQTPPGVPNASAVVERCYAYLDSHLVSGVSQHPWAPNRSYHFYRPSLQKYGPEQWLWDSGAHMTTWAHRNVTNAVLDLRTMLSMQRPDGRVPEMLFWQPGSVAICWAMAAVAAIVNLICLRMLQRTKEKDVSMRAATTFSFNDFIANGGIIIAGIIVMLTGANWPDLVVGIAVACIALYGGVQILRDAHHDIHDEEGTEHEGGDQFRL